MPGVQNMADSKHYKRNIIDVHHQKHTEEAKLEQNQHPIINILKKPFLSLFLNVL